MEVYYYENKNNYNYSGTYFIYGCGHGRMCRRKRLCFRYKFSFSGFAGKRFGYSDDNDTKVLQMLDKVTLNGKPVVLPFKLSDLGEGYSFDKNDVSVYEKDGNTYAYTDLLYNNKMITTVSLFEYAEGQKTEDFIVDMISYSYLDDESVK